MKAPTTIEDLAELAINTKTALIAGIMVARDGRFSKYFQFQLANNIGGEALYEALKDAAAMLNIQLRIFDGEFDQKGVYEFSKPKPTEGQGE